MFVLYRLIVLIIYFGFSILSLNEEGENEKLATVMCMNLHVYTNRCIYYLFNMFVSKCKGRVEGYGGIYGAFFDWYSTQRLSFIPLWLSCKAGMCIYSFMLVLHVHIVSLV